MPILALLFSVAPQTQDGPEFALHLQGDFLWRMELRDLSGERSHPASWRSRLSARGTPMPSLQVAAEWLTSIPTAGVPAKGSMSQVWVELEGFASRGTRLRMGRFPLKAGEGRLLGRDDWSLFPRAFDGWAWSGSFAGKDWTLFSTSVSPFPGRPSGEDILKGALGRWEDVAPRTSLEGWLLRSGNEEDVRIMTAGLGLKNEFSPILKAFLESNAQGGEDQGVSLSGSAAMGRIEWQLAPGHTLHMEHAFSSGDASGRAVVFASSNPTPMSIMDSWIGLGPPTSRTPPSGGLGFQAAFGPGDLHTTDSVLTIRGRGLSPPLGGFPRRVTGTLVGNGIFIFGARLTMGWRLIWGPPG